MSSRQLLPRYTMNSWSRHDVNEYLMRRKTSESFAMAGLSHAGTHTSITMPAAFSSPFTESVNDMQTRVDSLEPVWHSTLIINRTSRLQLRRPVLIERERPHGASSDPLHPRTAGDILCYTDGWKKLLPLKMSMRCERHCRESNAQKQCCLQSQ